MNRINLTPVKSSHLKSVGFDPVTKTMAVQFNDGPVYHYQNVPPNVHGLLMGATSKGKFFNRAVKGKFKSVRVTK